MPRFSPPFLSLRTTKTHPPRRKAQHLKQHTGICIISRSGTNCYRCSAPKQATPRLRQGMDTRHDCNDAEADAQCSKCAWPRGMTVTQAPKQAMPRLRQGMDTRHDCNDAEADAQCSKCAWPRGMAVTQAPKQAMPRLRQGMDHAA